jgi:hypothetical protein
MLVTRGLWTWDGRNLIFVYLTTLVMNKGFGRKEGHYMKILSSNISGKNGKLVKNLG